jgi:hypothetical protein
MTPEELNVALSSSDLSELVRKLKRLLNKGEVTQEMLWDIEQTARHGYCEMLQKDAPIRILQLTHNVMEASRLVRYEAMGNFEKWSGGVGLLQFVEGHKRIVNGIIEPEICMN